MTGRRKVGMRKEGGREGEGKSESEKVSERGNAKKKKREIMRPNHRPQTTVALV